MTNVTAGAAIVSPWWLPALQGVSEFASVVLPILGVAWLVIQIIGYFTSKRRRK